MGLLVGKRKAKEELTEAQLFAATPPPPPAAPSTPEHEAASPELDETQGSLPDLGVEAAPFLERGISSSGKPDAKRLS